MDKKEYIVKQLKRTYRKEYENYVITRIWHLINDLDIKIVTQQYIKRSVDINDSKKGFALADLYFPQFNLIVEVDEEHHLGTKLSDEVRDRDVINATNFEIERISTKGSIEDIHKKIDYIVKKIKKQKEKNNYNIWDYEKEFDITRHIERGYLDVEENPLFRKSVDAVNCFGFKDKALMKGGKNHPIKNNVLIWFPKLYEHNEWDNQITLDEEYIYEMNKNKLKNNEMIDRWINDSRDVRYCFGQYKDNLGRMLYHFKGEYTLDKKRTVQEKRAVWKRTSMRVETIKKDNN